VRSGTSCQRVPRHGGRSSSYSVACSLAVVSPFGDSSHSSDEVESTKVMPVQRPLRVCRYPHKGTSARGISSTKRL
jgi:hypothetical protein